ncbi:MAG: hypothetical protein A2033_08985 [Bacteroidetes bacterium GWA2_31_9]|nr:MAG: hypothetical protein A2033_08985 [Bacteroidetes bacterium GWA2_31_9]
MKIILSDVATTDYWQNIDYLLNKWDDKVAVDFIDKVEQVIYLISCNPNYFPKTNLKKFIRLTLCLKLLFIIKLIIILLNLFVSGTIIKILTN